MSSGLGGKGLISIVVKPPLQTASEKINKEGKRETAEGEKERKREREEREKEKKERKGRKREREKVKRPMTSGATQCSSNVIIIM